MNSTTLAAGNETPLRWTLRASAFYDLGAFALLLAMPRWLFELFDHPWPAEPFLFQLAALPLLMAPVVYWSASLRPRANDLLVRACVGLRVVGALGIAGLLLEHRPAGAMAYWTFVIGDVVWAALIEALRRRR